MATPARHRRDTATYEDRGHATRERRRPAREVPLVRGFRRVALEERDRPAVGEELELQDFVRVTTFDFLPVADERGDGVDAGDGLELDARLEPVALEGPRAAEGLADRAANLGGRPALSRLASIARAYGPASRAL